MILRVNFYKLAERTVHGRETRAIRAKRQQALAELKLLERMGKGFGVFN